MPPKLCGKASLLLAMFALATALLPAQAIAGAWLEEVGRGQLIFQATRLSASRSFSAHAIQRKASRFEKNETGAHMQYGVLPDLTLLATVQMALTSEKSGGGIKRGGEEEMRLLALGGAGARLRLWHNDNTVLSMELEIRRQREWRDKAQPPHHAPGEWRLRALLGHGFQMWDRPAFMEAQIGYTVARSSSRANAQLDLTAGIQVHDSVQIIGQMFNTLDMGPHRARAHKAQLSVVIGPWRDYRIQLGYVATVAGHRSLRERGFVSGVWRRF